MSVNCADIRSVLGRVMDDVVDYNVKCKDAQVGNRLQRFQVSKHRPFSQRAQHPQKLQGHCEPSKVHIGTLWHRSPCFAIHRDETIHLQTIPTPRMTSVTLLGMFGHALPLNQHTSRYCKSFAFACQLRWFQASSACLQSQKISLHFCIALCEPLPKRTNASTMRRQETALRDYLRWLPKVWSFWETSLENRNQRTQRTQSCEMGHCMDLLQNISPLGMAQINSGT